ncbi:MAG: DUF4349 domain-containing protein [Christensenellales bacterium]|jgi:hypothetical protein
MNCNEFISKLDIYIDGEMPDSDLPEFLQHAESCDDCCTAFKEAVLIAEKAKALAVAKAPDALLENVMAQVKERPAQVRKKWPLYAKVLTGVAACLLVFVVALASLNPNLTSLEYPGAEEYGRYDYDMNSATSGGGAYGGSVLMGGESAPQAAPVPAPSTASSAADYAEKGIILPPADNTTSAEHGQKIITNGNLSMSSANFDVDSKMIEDLIVAMGGYTQSSSISGKPLDENQYSSGRYGSYTARIPSHMYRQTVDQLKVLGVLENYSEYSDDITSQYYDTVARLESYQLQYDTIEGLLTKAEALEDILRIQTELQNLRYMIDSLTGTIKQWDFLTSYSTLDISIREVADPALVRSVDPTLGERINESFISSINRLIENAEDFVVWLSGSIIGLIIFAGAVVAVVLIIRSAKKRRLKKSGEKQG